MFEKQSLSEARLDTGILAYEIKEQLATVKDTFVQSTVSTYGTMLADRGSEFIYGSAHLTEEFEAAYLGLFMIGVQEANPVVATNALRLMSQPAHKWQAAVWAVKQGQGGLLSLWQEELGAAEAVAKETSSKDAFDVGLAQLELELLRAKTTESEGILCSSIDSLIFDLESNLKDIDAFPGALNCDTASLYRLEIARMLCLYSDFKRARQLRNQSTDAYRSELDHFDKMFRGERASKLNIIGLYTRLRMGRTQAQLAPDAPRSNLIYSMRKIYDYEWDVDPERVVATQHSRISASINSLDLFLRAGAYDKAVSMYEDFFTNDERRGGDTRSHRGIQVQAAALMHANHMQDRSAITAAEITAWFNEISAPASQTHATIAERGISGAQKSKDWNIALAALATMSDAPERARLSLQACELLASDTFHDADTLRLMAGNLLVKACHAWVRQIPGDARLDSLMKYNNPAILQVRHNMRQYVERIKKIGDLHKIFMAGQEVEALLQRTEIKL